MFAGGYGSGVRVVHWFRNDLRLHDNTALAAAAAGADELLPLFVLDPALLEGPRRSRARARFLLDCLGRLAADLAARGCPLIVRRGEPVDTIVRLLGETRADRLTYNRDYSPYARRRDGVLRARVAPLGVRVEDYKDRVVFESDEVRKADGGGFVVYTPFRNAWLARHQQTAPPAAAPPRLPRRVTGVHSDGVPSAGDLGLDADPTQLPTGGEAAAGARLAWFFAGPVRHYGRDRDLPGRDATSRLSPYLRLGVLSIRQCVRQALTLAQAEPAAVAGAGKWVDELIWREFYTAVLADHPRVLRGAFRRELAAVPWNHDEDGFRAWCEGRTGYPFVDAGMRQLAADRLDAQPRAHDRRHLPQQGSVDRLAARRGFLHAASGRRRPRRQQRRLAVGGLHRHRRAAVFPHLQSRRCRARSSIPTAPTCGASCRSWPTCRRGTCTDRGKPRRRRATIRRRSSSTPNGGSPRWRATRRHAGMGERMAESGSPTPRCAVVLVGHGGVPTDLPRHLVRRLKALEGERLARRGTPGAEEVALDRRIRDWPRTPASDPYQAGLEALAAALRPLLGAVRLTVAYNEFCAPSVEEAITALIAAGARAITVVPSMLTPGGSHAEIDIPQALARLRAAHPEIALRYAWPVDVALLARLLLSHLQPFM